MRRSLLLIGAVALCLALSSCQPRPEPQPVDLPTALVGTWQDPLTGWLYTFAADGAYTGEAPALADGVNRIVGAYELDAEGYLEFTLAQQVPRRPFTFYERRNVWHVIEIDDEHLVLVYGRSRVQMVRRHPSP